MQKLKFYCRLQAGFSLVELLVGLIIGLLASLVVMQTFSVFEGQKRTTTGNSDAQVNGSIALYTIQRDIQSAGYGLASFSTFNNILNCSGTTVDHDGNGATPSIGISPVRVTDGGSGSDSIRIRYAEDAATSTSGIQMRISNVSGANIVVPNNLGCKNQDVAFITDGTACNLTRVNDTNLDAAPNDEITVLNAAGAVPDGVIACIGRWNQFIYRIVNNQLQRNDGRETTDTPIIDDIVNMQIQYGISNAAGSDQIVAWVDPVGSWAAPSVPDRNRIRAIHLAIVARNGLPEKTDVTQPCTTAKGTANNGPCAWDDSDVPGAAPVIDLSADANWKRYRYRAYDTIVPLRNMIWSKI
jgi:type IV pilus assembly protein PilW